MFTGIVEECGSVDSFERASGSWRLRIRAARVLEGLAAGESVAVNGCCLTAVESDGAAVTFDVLEETRRLTNFGSLAAGAPVNLERSMRLDGRLGGHFVTGHIDGPGLIEAFEARGADHWLRVRGPAGCGRLLIYKGSIALDGISLTVAEVDGDAFAVWTIPHTIAVTNLRSRRTGEAVNLEFDMLGKYVEKLLQSQRDGA
ncbi:MAG TPA: riboflavin synthase [Opitutaceae bacterium]|nr:riboflavin synthase [Opitutaceae bacterium]